MLIKNIFIKCLLVVAVVMSCEDDTPLPTMPEYVDVIDVKDTALPTKNLLEVIKDKNSLVFFYSADCPFCKEQVNYYRDKYEYLKNFQVVLMSTKGTAEAINFQEEYQITALENIHHLIDKNQDLWKFTGSNSVPYNIVINKKNEILLQQSGILTIGTVDNLLK